MLRPALQSLGFVLASLVPFALCAPALCAPALCAPMCAHDSEWPPKKDAVDLSTTVPASLQMGRIRIAFTGPIASWLTHGHVQHQNGSTWTEYPLWFTLGDVSGPDDGDLDLVLCMPNELVVAGRLVVDLQAQTGTFTPTWVWQDPTAPAWNQPPGEHDGPPARNVLIWDLDGDGANEVSFVSKVLYGSCGGSNCKDALYVVKGDATLPNGPFGVPPPRVLASYTWIESSGMLLGERVGVARVRDTDGRRDIVTHSHSGNRLQLWSFTPSGGGNFALTKLFQRDSFTGNIAETHEFNSEDVDGDGFDEFFMDGVIDFVNADPVSHLATPVNTAHPMSGSQIWHTGLSGISENHMDQMIAADFDPANPGLEINSVPSLSFTTWDGVANNGRDLLWKADGHVLRTNADGPAPHGQSMYIGNWSSKRAGLETIYVPKGAGMSPPGSSYLGANYGTDALQEELTFEGAMFIAQDPLGQRAGGPVNWMDQIDWDGDYASDEIADLAWHALYVWRMGEKLDWSSWPDGMPHNATEAKQTFDAAGAVGGAYNWYWYNGPSGAWAFNFGGAGRYSHYYQKLGEAFAGFRYFMKPFDVGGDYREEIVTLTANPGVAGVFVDVYSNLATLAKPWLHFSPRTSTEYKRFRTEMVHSPLVYAKLPTADHIRVTPQTAGMSTVGGSVQFAAKLVYTDGSIVDITPSVTWQSDVAPVASVSSSGLASAAGTRGSAKIAASFNGLPCEAAYLYASTNDAPEVLYGGYEDSYLTYSLGPNMQLKVEARVAQRQNQPLTVFMLLPSGAYWPYPFLPIEYCGLYDDGQLAHGDDHAADGIYSNVIPYAGHPNLLAAGDNLRPIVSIVSATPSLVSRPWPYLVRGPNPTSMPDITGQFDNDAQGDARTPRIDWAGLRGFDDASYVYVEAHVIPPADTTVAVFDCKVSVNGGTPQSMLLVGDGTYVGIVASSLPNGTYFVDVYAEAFDTVAHVVTASDHWPRIRKH